MQLFHFLYTEWFTRPTNQDSQDLQDSIAELQLIFFWSSLLRLRGWRFHLQEDAEVEFQSVLILVTWVPREHACLASCLQQMAWSFSCPKKRSVARSVTLTIAWKNWHDILSGVGVKFVLLCFPEISLQLTWWGLGCNRNVWGTRSRFEWFYKCQTSRFLSLKTLSSCWLRFIQPTSVPFPTHLWTGMRLQLAPRL